MSITTKKKYKQNPTKERLDKDTSNQLNSSLSTSLLSKVSDSTSVFFIVGSFDHNYSTCVRIKHRIQQKIY